MDREYVNEQVREGITETVAYVRFEPTGSPAPRLVPLDDAIRLLKTSAEAERKRCGLDPTRFTVTFHSSALDGIVAQIEMAPKRQLEIDSKPLRAEAEDRAAKLVKASQDARRIEAALVKHAEPSTEQYDELLRTATYPDLTEIMLTMPSSGRSTTVARGGQTIEAVSKPFKSLTSSHLHRIIVKVGAVDDFQRTAIVQVIATPDVTSRALQRLLGEPVPLKLSPTQGAERRLLLTAQSSESQIVLRVTARLGLGIVNSNAHLLTLQSVMPMADQSVRFRSAHQTVQPMFEQMALFDRETTL